MNPPANARLICSSGHVLYMDKKDKRIKQRQKCHVCGDTELSLEEL